MPTYEEVIQERDELLRRVAEQQERLAEQEKRISHLEKLIEKLQRKGKRQAAPFSKGEPKAAPKAPGRKAGAQYGQAATRPVPRRVDEAIEVPCPLYCESCQGKVRLQGKESQYQIDLPPVRPMTTEFVVHYGECQDCGRRVHGRHSRQISSALGVGKVQLGPGVISWTAYLNKIGGLSYGKIADVLKEMADLQVSRSALCRAVTRLAKAAEPSYDKLVTNVQRSQVVYPDETGWRIGGQSSWLWTFVTPRQTVYRIARGRGYKDASRVLGEDYSGLIGSDGWAPYRRFVHATRQTCLAHLLRRCREMQEVATDSAAEFPSAVQALLQAALALRDRRDAQQISLRGVKIAKGHLQARLARLLAQEQVDSANKRLAKHLRRHENELFVFLERPEVEATNWPAEQAIRPAVVNRKSCAGNRTARGAHHQGILMSILRTGHQRQFRPIKLLTSILRHPRPQPHKALTASPPSR
jgi:transposase